MHTLDTTNYRYNDLSNLINSYLIVRIEDNRIIPVESYPTTCRDIFLETVDKMFREKEESSLTFALFITNRTLSSMHEIINIINFTWADLYKSYLVLNTYECSYRQSPGQADRPCIAVVFTLSRNLYYTPMTFWALTEDIRHTFTGFSKLNTNDYKYNDGQYIQLLNSLKHSYTYNLKIPLSKATHKGRFLNVHSPSGFLENIKWLMQGVVLNKFKITSSIRVKEVVESIALDLNLYYPNLIYSIPCIYWKLPLSDLVQRCLPKVKIPVGNPKVENIEL